MPRSRLALLPLAGHEVDRDYLSRSRPALFDELWQEASTRVLPLWNGRTLIRRGEPPQLELLGVEDATSGLVRVFLGRTLRLRGDLPSGAAIVTMVLSDGEARELEPDESRWVGLRAMAGRLDILDEGLFTEALAIVNWHSGHTHCSRCGMPTVVEQGGWVRRCFEDDTESFPRTDAAVIVGITDSDERILLGSNMLWDENRYSLLAGFVEPGESFEAAVLREIGEEAGIKLSGVEYLASQPWPFPASIMVGFRARLAAGQSPDQVRADGIELRDLRWFSRTEVRSASSGERPAIILPGESSIARAIIEDWLEESA